MQRRPRPHLLHNRDLRRGTQKTSPATLTGNGAAEEAEEAEEATAEEAEAEAATAEEAEAEAALVAALGPATKSRSRQRHKSSVKSAFGTESKARRKRPITRSKRRTQS